MIITTDKPYSAAEIEQLKQIIGALSNDLYRTACMIQRGSKAGAQRFATEAEKWAQALPETEVKPYIRKIVLDVKGNHKRLDMNLAEKYLMYSILLQNYTLHLE